MTGSIKKRSKNSWSAIIYLGRDPQTGKKQQKWYTFIGTKRDAQRELTRLLHEMNTGQYVEPSKMSAAKYIRKWLDHSRTKVSPKTHERYTQLVENNLVPCIGSIPLPKLQPLHVQEAYDRLLEGGRLDGSGGLSAQTVVHRHRTLRVALQQGVKWQLIVTNVADAVEPPTPRKREVRVLDEDQTVWFLEVSHGTRFYVLLVFTTTTGVRRGELLALRWSDLDLHSATATICRSVEQTRNNVMFKHPKNGKGRVIDLPPLTVEALRQHKVEQDRVRTLLGNTYGVETRKKLAQIQSEEMKGLVFAREDGTLWLPESFSPAFSDFSRSVGVHVRFHDIRHSHASQLLRAGVPVKVVSERLGHSAVGITLDTYGHVLPVMQKEAAAKIEAAFQTARRKQAKPVV